MVAYIYAYVAENQLVAESGTKVIIEIETPTKAIQCSLIMKQKVQNNVTTRDSMGKIILILVTKQKRS